MLILLADLAVALGVSAAYQVVVVVVPLRDLSWLRSRLWASSCVDGRVVNVWASSKLAPSQLFSFSAYAFWENRVFSWCSGTELRHRPPPESALE